jgi:hypothetical protein
MLLVVGARRRKSRRYVSPEKRAEIDLIVRSLDLWSKSSWRVQMQVVRELSATRRWLLWLRGSKGGRRQRLRRSWRVDLKSSTMFDVWTRTGQVGMRLRWLVGSNEVASQGGLRLTSGKEEKGRMDGAMYYTILVFLETLLLREFENVGE